MMDYVFTSVIFSGAFLTGFAFGFLVVGPLIAWLFNI